MVNTPEEKLRRERTRRKRARDRFRAIVEDVIASAGAGSTPNESDLFITTTAVRSTDTNVYTIPDLNIGPIDADRLTIGGLVFRAAATPTITSITVGGIAAIVDIESRHIIDPNMTEAAIFHVFTGQGTALANSETAEVVVTLSATAARLGVSLYRTTLYDSPTPTETGTAIRLGTPGTMSPDLTAADKGFVVACAYSAGGANQLIAAAHGDVLAGAKTITINCQSGTSEWTGLIEDIDAIIETTAASPMAAVSAGWKYP